MRQPIKIILALVLAAGVAAGCGSDDDSPSGDSGGSDTPTTTATTARSSEPPKRSTARGKMVNCIERAGFEVTHKDQDAAKATNYTIEGDDPGSSKKAEIVIHPNRDDAERSSIKAGEEKGINALAFGRAEFIRHESTDTEAGVLANCIAGAYVK